MKISKCKRRIMMGAAGLVLAGVVFAGEIMSSVVDVQATTRVLDGITTKYSVTNPIKILEVVDSAENANLFTYKKNTDDNNYESTGNRKSEMGYFMPSSNANGIGAADKSDAASCLVDPAKVSKGFLYGAPYEAGVTAGGKSVSDKQKFADYMMKLYTYGLVKPNGTDNGWVSNIGEYPILNRYALFSSSETKQCTYQLNVSVSGNDIVFAKGVYTPANGNGEFKLIDGYTDGSGNTYQVGLYYSGIENAEFEAGIDAATVKDYTICTYRTEEREVPVSDEESEEEDVISVSPNDVTVSGGDPEKVIKTFKIFTPLAVDTSKMGYPSIIVNGQPLYLIQKDNDAKGNLNFKETEITTTTPYMEYYGPNNMSNLWLNVGADNGIMMRNSDWLSEYVLGSNKTYYRTDAVYDVVPASKVTVDANSDGQSLALSKYDLVYISGQAVNFKTCDLSEDVVVALYNNSTNHLRQAIMMDYACYSGSIATKLDILCAMLWQTKDSKTSLYNADAAREETSQMFTVTSSEYPNKVTGTKKEYTDHTLKSFAVAEAAVKSGFVYSVETTKEDGSKEKEDKELKPLKDSMMNESFGNGNFVTGNVYVYDHAVANFDNAKAFVDAHDNFANGDLISKYTNEVTNTGLYAVQNYITAQNKNSLTGAMSTEITPAVCIQYILVSDGEDITIMKTSLNILEIQPVPAYLYNAGHGSQEYVELDSTIKENRKKFVTDYLPDYYADKMDYIGFTSMTVSEFNGKNVDLIENYDIIYIGDETNKGSVNYYNSDIRVNTADGKSAYSSSQTDNIVVHTRKSKLWNDVNNQYELTDADLSYFTDKNMIGNIYYNIGDKVDCRIYKNDGPKYWILYGLIDTQDVATTSESDSLFETVRYPGRDLTSDKLDKMKDFVDSRGLLIVAENLMGPITITDTESDKNKDKNKDKNESTKSTESGKTTTSSNVVVNPTKCSTKENDIDDMDVHGFVDSSSNLYELLQYGLGYRWNPETWSYVQNNGETQNKAFGNVVSAASIKTGGVKKADLAKYVSAEKVSLILYDSPVPYSYTTKQSADKKANYVIDTISYLDTADKDTGVRYLNYEFEINTDASVIQEVKDEETGGTAQVQAGYKPMLYIDINNDGKYSKTKENVSDILITYTNEQGQKVEAPRNEKTGEYNLEKGVRYTLRRDLSDDFRGLINWKLVVENTCVSTLHASEQGYTAVQAKDGKKKIINVLQLNHSDKMGESNLQEFLTYSGDDAAKLRWKNYMSNIPDYELHIKTMKLSDFRDQFYDAYTNRKTNYSNVPGIATMSVKEFALNYYFKDLRIWGSTDEGKGVSMLVTGFGDNYKSLDRNDENKVDDGFKEKAYYAAEAIYAFMEAGKPTLASHDFMSIDTQHVQTKVLRDTYGQDKYGVTKNIDTVNEKEVLIPRWDTANKGASSTAGKNYTHSGSSYTWSIGKTTTDNDRLQTLWGMHENTGKEIAFAPNTERKSTEALTQGGTLFTASISKKSDIITNSRASEDALWHTNTKYANNRGNFEGDWWDIRSNWNVDKTNEGQITTYPYILPDRFSVTITHSQWYELDLSTDADRDGESDLVVWYAFGETTEKKDEDRGSQIYSDSEGISTDPANGFYIYNKGNVTYTGAGHRDMKDASEAEIQLFVNTLLATFETGNNTPTIELYESPDINAKPTGSIAVPYDSNVTNPAVRDSSVSTGVTQTEYDSSVLVGSDNHYKYQFVDPNTSATDTKSLGTMAYFRMNDLNFVRGDKNITVKYYLLMDNAKNGDTVMVNVAGGTQEERTVKAIDTEKPEADQQYYGIDISKEIETYSVINGVVSQKPLARESATTNTSYGYVNSIKSNQPYGFYLPMNYLSDHARFTILVEAQTTITSVATEGGTLVQSTEKGYKTLTVTKTDLLDLD